MSDAEEYEVERILSARLVKKRGRSKKIEWKYNVRWKGYDSDEDTWEPTESFADSEHIIENFWQHAKTAGRDYNDLSLFTVGEEFYPIGPPPRKRKRLSTSHAESAQPTGSSGVRRQIDDPSNPVAPSRRTPSLPPIVSAPPALYRQHSFEVPGTPQPPLLDEEEQANTTSPQLDSPHQTSLPPISALNHELPKSQPLALDTCMTISEPIHRSSTPQVSSAEGSTLSLKRKSPSAIPSHRARAAKPLVKMVDDPMLAGLQNAIPAKARAAARGPSFPSPGGSPSTSNKSPRVPSSRAGPGRNSKGLNKNRSSLLTFEKGALKSVKGRYNADSSRVATASTSAAIAPSPPANPEFTDTDWHSAGIPGLNGGSVEPEIQPTSAELLQLAGLNDSTAADLPDYKDELSSPIANLAYPAGETPAVPQVDSTTQPSKAGGVVSALFQTLNAAKATLFPASESASSSHKRKWRHSDASNTIFGPMASGSGEISPTESSLTSSFFLSFDSNSSVRVCLAGILPPETGASTLDEIIQTQPKGLPGKFYQNTFAHTLLGTLRACGPSAKVVPIDSETDVKQQSDFQKFKDRLKAGDLFVQPVSAVTLVFCAPENSELAQRLNFPKEYLTEKDQILVSCVTIENVDAYTNLTENADASRW